jgi:hypothetical protein
MLDQTVHSKPPLFHDRPELGREGFEDLLSLLVATRQQKQEEGEREREGWEETNTAGVREVREDGDEGDVGILRVASTMSVELAVSRRGDEGEAARPRPKLAQRRGGEDAQVAPSLH